MADPLLITADDSLADEVHRLAAASGSGLEVRPVGATAVLSWSAAPLVLVGSDAAGELASSGPPRRAEVFLVTRGEPDYRRAMAVGARDVLVLPMAADSLARLFSESTEATGVPALTLGVVGGSGGVGATTFACALALVAAARGRPALVDLDPWGSGIEQVVGAEVGGPVGWPALGATQGRIAGRALRDSLPRAGEVAVVGWGTEQALPPSPRTVHQTLAALRRGHEVVVVDLPRALDERLVPVLTGLDHVLLVAACSMPGSAAAARQMTVLGEHARSVQLVARPGALPADCLADALGVPLLVELAHCRALVEQVDLGLGPVYPRRSPVARAARTALHGLLGAEVVRR